MALLLGGVGLFVNPFLLLIAVFVWFGASQEANAARMRSSLEGVAASRAMVPNPTVFRSRESLGHALELALSGIQGGFPVIDNWGHLVGAVSRRELLEGVQEHGPWGSVEQVMSSRFGTLQASEPLPEALDKLEDRDSSVLPVLHNGRLVGVITAENLVEYAAAQEALRGGKFRVEAQAS
jgi:CBS domain-containing protein